MHFLQSYFQYSINVTSDLPFSGYSVITQSVSDQGQSHGVTLKYFLIDISALKHDRKF